MNKRGVANWKPFIVGAVIVGIILFIGFLLSTGMFSGWLGDAEINTDTEDVGDSIGNPAWNWLTYIFGGVPTWLANYNVSPTGALIITIAMFFLIFITFGDIIQNFSTFSAPVAWISAFLIAIIAANFKFTVSVLSVCVAIFAPLAGFAVLAGLSAAFLVFFVLNWGIGSFGPWIMRRKAMMYANRTEISTEKGARDVSAAIKGMKTIGESLK